MPEMRWLRSLADPVPAERTNFSSKPGTLPVVEANLTIKARAASTALLFVVVLTLHTTAAADDRPDVRVAYPHATGLVLFSEPDARLHYHVLAPDVCRVVGQADLNGDGRADAFLLDFGDYSATSLVIEERGNWRLQAGVSPGAC